MLYKLQELERMLAQFIRLAPSFEGDVELAGKIGRLTAELETAIMEYVESAGHITR